MQVESKQHTVCLAVRPNRMVETNKQNHTSLKPNQVFITRQYSITIMPLLLPVTDTWLILSSLPMIPTRRWVNALDIINRSA